MDKQKNVIEHLQIIRTWAELDGKMGRGMEPKCCLRVAEWIDDALELLKAQQPRVMTLADVNNIGPEDVCAFIEIREETHMYACYMHQYDETHTEIMCNVPNLLTKLQNGCVRLWTSRPTDEQREATKWNN